MATIIFDSYYLILFIPHVPSNRKLFFFLFDLFEDQTRNDKIENKTEKKR